VGENVVEGEVFDSRALKFGTEVVFVASGLGSKSSLTAEGKQCTAIHCKEIERRPLKLPASRLFAEERVDVEREVPYC
jgi:plasmid replication initiation protein